jgi:hypothetical protein
MIVLVLSTPRSGSHYYTELVRKEYDNSIVIHEAVSRAAKNIYLRQDGNIEYSGQYTLASYYEDLVEGLVVRQFATRPVSYFHDLVNVMINSNKTYIVHEHVSLVPESWLATLITNSQRVVYLKRATRKEQLASRIIAGYTGVYLVKENYMLCHGDSTRTDLFAEPKFDHTIADEKLIRSLVDTYNAADARMKNIDTVLYEDLPVRNTGPTKLFASSFNRLCVQDQKVIERVLQDCDL